MTRAPAPPRGALAHAVAASLLVALAVLVFNPHHVFPPDLRGDGDISANGLLVRDAADLALGHGPYSRLGFHHPGPVTFYGLAAVAPLMPGIASPLGRERAAMLAFNTLALGAALLLAVRLGGRLLDAWLAAACLCVTVLPIATTGHHPLLDYWGPLVVILPAFVLVAAAGPLLRGAWSLWPVFCAAGLVVVHNHIANLVVAGPLALAVAAAAARRRWRGGAGPDRRTVRWLALGFVLVLVTSIPIVAEELGHADGNLTRTLRWLGEQPHQDRSVADVVRAAGWSAAVALTLGVPGLDRAVGLVPAWLVVLLVAGAAAVGLGLRRRARAELGAAAAAAGAAWLLLLVFAWRTPENPLGTPYVFHEAAAFAAFFLWLAVRRPLLALVGTGPGARRRSLAVGAAAALVCGSWSARFPVAPAPADPVPDTLWAALPQPAEGPLNAYLEHGHQDHHLWPRLTAFVLQAEQRGYRVRVPQAWSVVHGRRRGGPALAGAPLVLLSGRDLEPCLGPPLGGPDGRFFRVLGPGWSFDHLGMVLPSCGLPPLDLDTAYGADLGVWAWTMWHGPEAAADGAYRWSQGDSSRVEFAAGPALAARPDPVLELRLGALGRQPVTVALNGQPLGGFTLDGFAARTVRLPVPTGLLRSGPGNALAFAVPGATSPGDGDPRRLGVRLVGLRFATGAGDP